MTPEDQSIIFDIAQAAMEGCNWPSLRDRLLEVASEEALDRAWMALAAEVGRVVEPLMAE